MQCGVCSGEQARALVLDDLGDCAHRALFDAVATGDAGVLVYNLGDAVDNLEDVLRARINADTTADAIVSLNNWMRHGSSSLLHV